MSNLDSVKQSILEEFKKKYACAEFDDALCDYQKMSDALSFLESSLQKYGESVEKQTAKRCIEFVQGFDFPGKFVSGVVPVKYVKEAIEKEFSLKQQESKK